MAISRRRAGYGAESAGGRFPLTCARGGRACPTAQGGGLNSSQPHGNHADAFRGRGDTPSTPSLPSCKPHANGTEVAACSAIRSTGAAHDGNKHRACRPPPGAYEAICACKTHTNHALGHEHEHQPPHVRPYEPAPDKPYDLMQAICICDSSRIMCTSRMLGISLGRNARGPTDGPHASRCSSRLAG